MFRYSLFCSLRSIVFTRTLSFQSHDTVKIRNTAFTATTKNLVMPKSSLKIIITRGHKRIQNPVKHLRWSVLQKYLTNISRELFLQNASSQIFNRVLNMPGLPVDGLYIDIPFSTSNQCWEGQTKLKNLGFLSNCPYQICNSFIINFLYTPFGITLNVNRARFFTVHFSAIEFNNAVSRENKRLYVTSPTLSKFQPHFHNTKSLRITSIWMLRTC